MAVAHSAASESHTGTTGSTNQATFTWTHTQTGTPQGVVVFVSTYASVTDLITSVTYGGVALTRLTGGLAQDGAGELGRLDTFFLGSGLGTGNQTITVNRTNNATVMYAAAATVTAGANTAVPTETIVLLEGDGTLTEQSVDDTSPGQNSVRYAGAYSGLQSPPGAGASSTLLNSIDIGNYGSALVRETTAGQGARSVGFSAATDDRAVVHLAIRELVPRTETPIVGAFTLTGQPNTLAHGLVMIGAKGTFTFTGNPASTRHNVSITGERCAFTLTGNPATTNHNNKITGERGAFTFTGQPATFTKTVPPKVLLVDRGIFALTGNTATLKQAHALAGGTGTFILTGNPASLTQTWRLDAAVGTYALTGNPVTLAIATQDTLFPLRGVFTLSSNGATLARGRLFAADRGQFTLTGQLATLVIGRAILGSRGTFLLTGNPAVLTTDSFITANRGIFSFTGQPATFRRTYSVTVTPGIYTLTGNPAGFSVPSTYDLSAERGIFTLLAYQTTLSKTSRRRNILIF